MDGTMLNVEATFCYPSDMLCSGGGCGSATTARCCIAWVKFRKLLPVLTIRHLSSKIRSNVYETCVLSAMLHGSETRGANTTDLPQLHCNDHVMTHCICGTKDRDETPSSALPLKRSIKAVLHNQQLRWYRHAQRAMSFIQEGIKRHCLNV